jgi:membrane associated rhomboid family serine protease
MFLPIGDDVEKRHVPVIGICLVVVNVFVYLYTVRLLVDSLPQNRSGRGRHTVASFDIKKSEWWKFNQEWGLVPADLPKGKLHGILAYMFLHGDLFHLLGNMLVLWAFVGTLENALGKERFFGFYLLWGVIAGATHAAMKWGDDLPMIGASGAVAGMIGAYVVVFGALAKIRTLIWIIRPIKVNLPAGLYVLIWLLSQLSGIEEETETGGGHVAYYAHLGGFAAGAATMLLLRGQVLSRMVLSDAGVLKFKEEPDADAMGAADSAEENEESALALATVVPSACPHCGTHLTEDNKIAEKLFRCPSPDCKRLIYR